MTLFPAWEFSWSGWAGSFSAGAGSSAGAVSGAGVGAGAGAGACASGGGALSPPPAAWNKKKKKHKSIIRSPYKKCTHYKQMYERKTLRVPEKSQHFC